MKSIKYLALTLLLVLFSTLSYSQKNDNTKRIREDVLSMLESRNYTIKATSLPGGYEDYFLKYDNYLKISGTKATALLPIYKVNPDRPLEIIRGEGRHFGGNIENYTTTYNNNGSLTIKFECTFINELGLYNITIYPDGTSAFSISFNKITTMEFLGKVVTTEEGDLAYEKANMSDSDKNKAARKLEKEKSKYKGFDTVVLDSIFSDNIKIKMQTATLGDRHNEDISNLACYLNLSKELGRTVIAAVNKNNELQACSPFSFAPQKYVRERTKEGNVEIQFDYQAGLRKISFTVLIQPNNNCTVTLTSPNGDSSVYTGIVSL